MVKTKSVNIPFKSIIFFIIVLVISAQLNGPGAWAAGTLGKKVDAEDIAQDALYSKPGSHQATVDRDLIAAEETGKNNSKNVSPGYVQRELMRKIRVLYREIAASYKANLYTHAQDKILVLEELLDPKLLPSAYCRKMTMNLGIVKERMRKHYMRQQQSERKEKEDRMLQQMVIGSWPKINRGSSVRANETVDDNAGSQDPSFAHARFKKIVTPRQRAAIIHAALVKRQRDAKQELLRNLAAIYEDGLKLYRRGIYYQANQRFSEVNKLSPGYKLAREYLQLIQKHIDPGTASVSRYQQPEQKVAQRERLIKHYLDAAGEKQAVTAMTTIKE